MKGTFVIPEPCHENWNKMTPVEKGRFCAVCSKCVVDLTEKSKPEIKELYDQHNGNMCGLVKTSQLGKTKRDDYLIANRSGFISKIQLFALSLIAAFGMFFSSVNAQSHGHVKGKISYKAYEGSIEGKVTYSNGKPAKNAKVILNNDFGFESETVTDEKGRYSFSYLRSGKYSVTAYSDDQEAFGSIEISQSQKVRKDLVLEEIELRMLGEVEWIPEEENTDAEIIDIETEEVTGAEGEGVEMVSQYELDESDIINIDSENVRSEEFDLDGVRMSIYPNPTSGKVKVEINGEVLSESQIYLTNLEGKVIFKDQWSESTISKEYEIDLSVYPDGIYLLNTEINGLFRFRKIVKQ